MALASQTARLSEVGRTSFRTARTRRRSRVAPVAVGLILVAGLASLGWFWLADHKPKADGAEAAGAIRDPLSSTFAALPAADLGADQPSGVQPPAREAVQPISIISMGAPQGGPATGNTPSPQPSAAPPESNRPAPTQPLQPPVGIAPDQAPAPAPPPASIPTAVSSAVAGVIAECDRMVAAGRLPEARTALNAALTGATPTGADAIAIRDRIAKVNETLVFSPVVAPGDPLSSVYVVRPGDTLVRITAEQNTQTDWRFIQRINKMSDPRRLNVGQKLKIVKGPFHAVVSKSDYRLDLYAGDIQSPGDRVFIRSFRVGLGENNSTPVGAFVVRPQSKLINPTWANPRTGEFFAAENPQNPIGEHWIGLDPADAATAAHTQYGLHGTVEPDSIGQQKSMGCVRLLPDEIALLYEMLVDRASVVRIEP